MTSEPRSVHDRRTRRAARRRQARRRRVVALLVAGSLSLVALGLGARAGSGKGSRPAPTVERSTASESPAATHPSLRSRLGSGRPVTLAFAGDVHFESPIRERLAVSPASVLAPVAPALRRADVAMVNLETAVTDRGEPAAKEFVFRAPATAFAALHAGGVDVATIANNHGLDFGATGLRDTLAAGRRSDVAVVGGGLDDDRAYAPFRATVHGQRIAIIGATQVLDDDLIGAWSAGPGKAGLASAKDEARLLRAVREARRTSDTLVVYVHWGVELTGCPTRSQTSLADELTAAGADVVVGSHAHVLLGTGRKHTALVSYGLGNFVFYASSPSTTESGVLRVTVTGRRIDRYGWIPARISGGIPYLVSGTSRLEAVRRWRSLRGCTDLR